MTLALLLISLAALVAALVLIRVQRRRRIRGERPAIVMRQLQARIAVLREELATERMRVVACGAAANGIRTPESSPYWSPSHADVCRLADRAVAQADLLASLRDAPLRRFRLPESILADQGFTPTPPASVMAQNSLHRGTAPTTPERIEMNTHLTAQRRGFIKGSATVYSCRCCKRSTRPTGTGDNDNVRLCVECFELAGEENALSDNGEFYGSKAEVLRLIEAVTAKGGNAACWDDLKRQASL